MIIKNRNLKVHKVISLGWQSLCEDYVTKVQHRDVYISGLDADDDPFVVTLHDPTIPLPKEGDSWTLPEGGHYSLLQ